MAVAEAIRQALANVRLEGLQVSGDLSERLEKAIIDNSVDTEMLLNICR